MTPGARVAAAIELVAAVEAAPQRAADRLIAAFFRARRYAGAKDRAAVIDLAWAVLRRRGELLWRREVSGGAAFDGAPPDAVARALVLAALALEQDLDLAEIAALCDGGTYAPEPLSDPEKSWIEALHEPRPSPPDRVAGAYPAWLEDPLRRRFGEELVPEMEALTHRAPADFRVNTLKTTRAAALAALAGEGVGATPMPFSPLGVRLDRPRPLERSEAFLRGWIEPQDEASQLVALLVDARPGMAVVDLCAGAGGKALALAAALAGEGRLIAVDADPDRLKRLAPRAERAGARFIECRDAASVPLAPGGADRVLLDVPCSGSGAWRRRPEGRWRLTKADLERDLALQAALLDRGAALVRPGGRLIYATCSLLPEEDEDQVQAFLARRPEFRRLDAAALWAEILGGPAPFAGPDLLMTPKRHGTDGFYAAVLTKT